MSAAFQAGVRGDGSAQIVVELATLEHPTWSQPLRVVNVAEEGYRLISQGREFVAYPFQLVWPERNPDNAFAGAQFVINNVVAQDGSDEPVVLAALRGLPSEARVRLEAVRVATPDVIEQRTTRLRLTSITYVEQAITGVLTMPRFTDRRAGARFTPDIYRDLRAG